MNNKDENNDLATMRQWIEREHPGAKVEWEGSTEAVSGEWTAETVGELRLGISEYAREQIADAHNAALRAQDDKWRDRFRKFGEIVMREGKQDTERLDWLDTNAGQQWVQPELTEGASNIREAIDAAMSETGRGERGEGGKE